MAISRETIEKKNIYYSLLKPYVDFITKIYFRTTVNNFDKVPTDEIIIYAPNHQNALMDALAVLATVNTEPVFLARADIFKKRTIEKILTFLKILPIYRIRDGKESLKNNDAIFQKTIDVLKNKNGLVILPEGSHAGIRKLRPLKKGIFRIAFEAEEANNFKLNIKIIPVGLDWSHYSKFRSRLFVNYGEPISVSDYYEEYKKNAPRALTLLRERLEKELKRYMIHIENDEFYDMIDQLRYIYLPEMIRKKGLRWNKQPNMFNAQKEIIKKLETYIGENPSEAIELKEKTGKYITLLEKLNLRNWVIQKGRFSMPGILGQLILSVMLLPVFIYGAVVNYLPYKVPVILTRKVKDPQFISSFRDVIGMLLFPIYYIILGIISHFIDAEWYYKLAFFIFSPIAGLFAFRYYIGVKKLFAKIRFTVKTWFKNKDLQELKQCYFDIIQKINSL